MAKEPKERRSNKRKKDAPATRPGRDEEMRKEAPEGPRTGQRDYDEDTPQAERDSDDDR
jgi:hypothetical protein